MGLAEAMERVIGEEWTKRVLNLVSITYPIVVGVGGFFGTKVLANDLRLTSIEANRYTQKDAYEDRAWVSAEFVKIRQEQAELLRNLNDKHVEMLQELRKLGS